MYATPCTRVPVSFSWELPYWLGSWYGVLCAPVFIGLFAGRALLEEGLLREELEGYDAYMARVKYRFFPHVW